MFHVEQKMEDDIVDRISVTGMCEDCNDITKVSLYRIFASIEYVVVEGIPIGEHYLCNQCANKIQTKESV